jgi:hypothetical protein
VKKIQEDYSSFILDFELSQLHIHGCLSHRLHRNLRQWESWLVRCLRNSWNIENNPIKNLELKLDLEIILKHVVAIGYISHCMALFGLITFEITAYNMKFMLSCQVI